jgi:hypothetical protein
MTQLQCDGPAKPQVSPDLCWNLRTNRPVRLVQRPNSEW